MSSVAVADRLFYLHDRGGAAAHRATHDPLDPDRTPEVPSTTPHLGGSPHDASIYSNWTDQMNTNMMLNYLRSATRTPRTSS